MVYSANLKITVPIAVMHEGVLLARYKISDGLSTFCVQMQGSVNI